MIMFSARKDMDEYSDARNSSASLWSFHWSTGKMTTFLEHYEIFNIGGENGAKCSGNIRGFIGADTRPLVI